jgi:hypothetical protein
MQQAYSDSPSENAPSEGAPPADVPAAPAMAPGAPCPECAARGHDHGHLAEQYVYAIGRMEVRFPSLGIEREYQQRERQLQDLQRHSRHTRIRAVLEKNPHLALRVRYVFLIDGTPVYALTPAMGALKEAFLGALAHADDKDHYCVVIGRLGPFASVANHGGLLLSTVLVDQLYCFDLDEWCEGLIEVAQPAMESRQIESEHFEAVSRNVFREVGSLPENLGSSDGHRALNYLLAQHPGMFLAAAERRNHMLDHIDTRVAPMPSGRRHVIVILTFLDRATGVPERLYCTVDVTEEWPFVVGTEASASPLGFAPFVDSAFYAGL